MQYLYQNAAIVFVDYLKVSYHQVQTALNNTAGDSTVFLHAAKMFKDLF